MELFNRLAETLSSEITATIVIKKSSTGKMTVITNFTTDKGGVCDTVAPFTLKGTPQELDEGFLEAITPAAESFDGLVSNIAEFQKSVKQAEKNATSSGNKVTSANNADFIKKIEEDRKRKEAEEKARKENFDKALNAAKESNAHGDYFTAEALLNHALTLTDDKKIKSDLSKQIKNIAPNKEGFLCMDNAEIAQRNLDQFTSTLVKTSTDENQKKEAAEMEDLPENTNEEFEETQEENA